MSSYAVVYHGNEGSSAIIRFLKNLFTGGEAEPSVVAVPGTTPGALYHYQDFQSSSTLTTTPHSINDAGMSGSSASSIWSFANNRAFYTSSASSGSYNTSSQGAGSLSLPMVSSVSMQSSGSLNANSGGSGGSSGGSSGGLSSSGGMALFAVGFPKSNLVTAVNNQSNSNASQNNGGTSGNNGDYDGDGWLNDPSEPMPVGDATLPMLIFASCYALLIYRKAEKKKLKSGNIS